jgi:tellurite resistance protein TerC
MMLKGRDDDEEEDYSQHLAYRSPKAVPVWPKLYGHNFVAVKARSRSSEAENKGE